MYVDLRAVYDEEFSITDTHFYSYDLDKRNWKKNSFRNCSK